MKKKLQGMLSISVLLLCISLIFLLSVLSNYSNSVRSVNYQVLGAETASSQADSAAYSLRKLVQSQGVAIDASTSNISFEMNSSTIGLYTEKERRLMDFLESAYSSGSLNFSGFNPARPTFNIRPFNINAFFTPQSISIVPYFAAFSSGKIIGYDVLLKANEPGATMAWEYVSELPPSSPDAIYLHMGFQGSDRALSESKYVNRSDTNRLVITTASGKAITVDVNSESILDIYSNATFWAKTAIILNYSNLASAPYVELDENIINVRSEDGSAWSGPATVAEYGD